MSAFNNNNTNLNNTSAGIEGRGSQLSSSINPATTPNHNNIESAYQRSQSPQTAELKPGNNLNDTYNHYQPGQPGAGPGALNENHGIAATGLNEPHTHATVAPIHGDLNNKVEQHQNYGNTAGQDLNSHTNRTGGTGIPPVNTAEHVRRNQAEEAVLNSENNNHTHTNNETTHHKSHTASLGDHGASHHDKKVGGVSHAGHTAAKENEIKHGGLAQDETKVSAGEKIKGNLEKVVGKITGNEEKVLKGENILQGRAA